MSTLQDKNYIERKNSIKLWFSEWLNNQMEYMYDEIMYGIKNKDQDLFFTHIIENHLNKTPEELKNRIYKKETYEATTFHCNKKDFFLKIKEAILDKDNISDLIDWLASYDDTDDWFLWTHNPFKSIGYKYNTEKREIEEEVDYNEIQIRLEKKGNIFVLKTIVAK